MAENGESASEILFLADAEATADLGARLAGRLRPGMLVLLEGDLGAGKTALARAMIRTLLADPALEVPSPSFALVQPYRAPAGPVLHADLYRLGAAAEIAELGLFEDPRAIVLVEWPDRAPELAGRADLRVTLGVPVDGVGRVVRLHGRAAAEFLHG
jgi:tRNA threonylcarbamoyl adenosine modification protein YjeE